MIINIREFLTRKKKENLDRRLSDMLGQDRKGIEKASKQVAVSKETEATVITAEEIAEMLNSISPSGFIYRVTLPGAIEMYRRLNLGNLGRKVSEMGHMEKEEEFLEAMCVIDKCEEAGDYESMAKAFRIFEYVVRHNKTNTPTVTYARQFVIEMRRYLEELNLL